MSILDPKLCILDEADSGLDIDALKSISENINKFINLKKVWFLLPIINDYLIIYKPDYVHIMYNGKIIKTWRY